MQYKTEIHLKKSDERKIVKMAHDYEFARKQRINILVRCLNTRKLLSLLLLCRRTMFGL